MRQGEERKRKRREQKKRQRLRQGGVLKIERHGEVADIEET